MFPKHIRNTENASKNPRIWFNFEFHCKYSSAAFACSYLPLNIRFCRNEIGSYLSHAVMRWWPAILRNSHKLIRMRYGREHTATARISITCQRESKSAAASKYVINHKLVDSLLQSSICPDLNDRDDNQLERTAHCCILMRDCTTEINTQITSAKINKWMSNLVLALDTRAFDEMTHTRMHTTITANTHTDPNNNISKKKLFLSFLVCSTLNLAYLHGVSLSWCHLKIFCSWNIVYR